MKEDKKDLVKACQPQSLTDSNEWAFKYEFANESPMLTTQPPTHTPKQSYEKSFPKRELPIWQTMIRSVANLNYF
jgi:hypothetical protein